MKRSWLLICLINFLIAALMGLLLRLVHIYPVSINYQYVIHAHSHTAMLGWAYMLIFCLVVKQFVPKDKVSQYRTLFWLTQLTVIGMMISFPLQGYGLFSITFSTLHIFCSYYFAYKVRKNVEKNSALSYYLLQASLLFMVVSTLGAWSLGAAGATGGKNTPLYYSSLQFFLHFQFNGWFIFAVLALFFKHLENRAIHVNVKWFRIFYASLILSAILTMALPLSWYYPHTLLQIINTLGIGIQLVAFGSLAGILWPSRKVLFSSASGSRLLLILPLFSLFLKMGIQAVTAFPCVAIASHTVRNFTIGFTHLAMLGIITGFLFFFIKPEKNKYFNIGIAFFYAGFICTEVLLFIQGLSIFLSYPPLPAYFSLLFFASTLLPAGLLLIIAAFAKKQKVAAL